MFRRLTGGVAAIAMLIAAGGALAQDFSAERLAEGIRTISADEFQGRYPGEIGEEKTLAWLQAQYEAIGLEPGGPDGQWLQPVSLYRFTPARPATASWTGPDGAVHTMDVANDILLRSRSDDGKASIADAPVVFAGFGITAPERNWDDYGDIDVAGKVVLVVAGEPDGELFRGEVNTLYSSLGYKIGEALRRGAVGVLTLVTQPSSDPAWQRRAQAPVRPRTTVPGLDPIPLTGTINRDVAMAWAAAGGVDFATFSVSADGPFKAAELPGVRLTADVEETREVIASHNLLARIPGTQRPNETIVFSAHWDHVGTRHTPEGEDGIFNGAWDNASGTVAIVEMARELAAAPRPERTIVFAHMTAEEQGLLGAYAYVIDPVYPLETTVADLNIDMLPLSGPTRDLPIFGLGQNSLEDDLQELATVQGRTVTDDGQPEQGFYFRSDHFPFAKSGVPALMPWHGVDLVEGGREVGKPAYDALFRAHYHRPSDEWRDEYELGAAIQNLELMYRLALKLANSNDWPTWKADSEFGQVRARTDAARQ